MFNLCQRIEGGLEPLTKEFGDFVKNKGLDALAHLSQIRKMLSNVDI